MSLKDHGFRFCLSPCATKARWLYPVEFAKVHPEWLDVTDWPSDELAAYLAERLPMEVK